MYKRVEIALLSSLNSETVSSPQRILWWDGTIGVDDNGLNKELKWTVVVVVGVIVIVFAAAAAGRVILDEESLSVETTRHFIVLMWYASLEFVDSYWILKNKMLECLWWFNVVQIFCMCLVGK